MLSCYTSQSCLFIDFCAFDHVGSSPGIMSSVVAFIYMLFTAQTLTEYSTGNSELKLTQTSCKSQRCTPPPPSAISDVVLLVWDGPQWECSRHMIRAFLLLQRADLPARHCLESVLPSICVFLQPARTERWGCLALQNVSPFKLKPKLETHENFSFENVFLSCFHGSWYFFLLYHWSHCSIKIFLQ